MKFIHNDGGRKAAGFKGDTGDCVVRAVAIATQQSYEVVYRELSLGQKTERRSKHNPKGRHGKSVRNGVRTHTTWFKNYMDALGWKWTPTMHIGSGCKVHLTDGELPMGRLIVAVSKHYTTVIDGVVHDTHDPQREPLEWYGPTPVMDADGQMRNPIIGITGGRCVYGYWSQA